MRVAIDAMGGDHAPEEVVHGALGYAAEHPGDDIILVGDTDRITAIAGRGLPAANVSVVHASQVVEMHEHPALALREKKDASILVATDLVRRGEADAVVTAGHTGAGMAAAVLRLGRLPGVDRPALAVQMITATGPFVFLDIGANPDSSGDNLYQYAEMGALFAEKVLGVDRPRVALLSIGEEKGKGDARIVEATQLLDRSDLNFVGNVEGKDLVKHMADVVVCDAVVGNVTIKFFEGLSTFIFDLLAAEFRRPPRGPLAYALLKPGIGPDPLDLRLRAVRWVAPPGGQGHGDHHPRPGQAADDRLRPGGRRGLGPGADPGAHRRDLPARAGPAGRCRSRGGGLRRAARRVHRGPSAPGRGRDRSMSAPADLTVARAVVDELIRLAAMEVPGVVRVDRPGPPCWRRCSVARWSAGSTVAGSMSG